MNYAEYYERAKRYCPEDSGALRSVIDAMILNDSRPRKQRVRTSRFCTNTPSPVTVNINININEPKCEDCVCNQILVRMLNGKEYWL